MASSSSTETKRVGSTGRTRLPSQASLPSSACPVCRGMGFVTHDLPVDHPDFGRAVPCECTLSLQEARRLASLADASNLQQVDHMTFATFRVEGQGLPEAKHRNLRQAYDVAREFAREPHGWLVFFGGYGCGKTHLAAAIAHERVAKGEPALFVIVPDLLDYLRSTFAPDSPATFDERFETLRESPLLILDDFGAQSNTPWAEEKLYQLLNHRYNVQIPTVITSNCRLEDIEQRLRSRLADPALVTMWNILAPDFRMGADQTLSDLSTLRHHADQTFENFDLRSSELPAEQAQNLKKAMDLAEKFAARPEGWVVFTGPYGCGKTHLAAAIANRFVSSGGTPPMFIVVPDLLDHLRATFGPQSRVSFDRRFESVRTSPLLILDDLGTESATPWAKEKLFQLLNHRYSARLPTVITTSSAVEEIEDQDPRLASRMLDHTRSTVFGIIAPSYRGGPSGRKRKRTR
jgi:DNA replication protein DnaC